MRVYIRRVKTSSGATAVQIAQKRHGKREILEHLGSAHDEVTLASLEQVAREKIQAGQMAFDLDLHTDDTTTAPAKGVDAGGGLVLHGTRPRVLWEVLEQAYERIGFTGAVNDEVLKHLVLARVIEPTSKLDSLRVLAELNVENVPSYATLKRHLARCVPDNWRDLLSSAAYRFAADGGAVSVCLYDVTTVFRGRRGRRTTQVRVLQRTPDRPPDPRRTAGRPARVPAGAALLRGQQGRDPDHDPRVGRLPGSPPGAGHAGGG
ncbi:hypothetical protein LG284_00295 [Citricoccus nitrophenolicus]